MTHPSRLLLLIPCLVICGCTAPENQTSSATPSRQRIHLYVRTLPDKSRIYYYSAEATPPAGYSATTDLPELQSGNFDAAMTPQPGMVPVYSFTIPAGDGLIYYLSLSKETPLMFSDRKIQFYAYAAPQPGTIPVYLYTILPHATQVYYYSTSETAPPGFPAPVSAPGRRFSSR